MSEGERIIAHVRAMLDTDPLNPTPPPLQAEDVLQLSRSVSKSKKFRKQVAEEINDPETQDAIVYTLRELEKSLKSEEKVNSRRADMVGSAGVAPAASVTATAVVLVVTSGGALLPVAVLVGGVVGVAAALYGRGHLKQKADQAGEDADQLKRFVDKLEDAIGGRP